MKQIQPLILREKYYAGIEQEIKAIIYEIVYKPIIDALEISKRELKNSSQALLDAIEQGTVWYREGHFYGEFNSRISRDLRAIGAKFNPRSSTWSLATEVLPTDIRFAQAAAASRYDKLRTSLVQTLDTITISSIDTSRLQENYKKSIDWMNNDFNKAISGITVAPQLTDQQKKFITDEWGKNLDKYIKNWVDEDVLKLRERVTTNAFQGYRSTALINMIQQNYGVSQRKAKFLARQETSLLMAKFRETRAKDIGSTRYRWSGSNDARERPDHKALNGHVFFWDSPPVTNRSTGARNNPGEDYGCRCIAIPLVD